MTEVRIGIVHRLGQDEAAGGVEGDVEALGHDDGGGARVDDDRAGRGVAGRHQVAVEHLDLLERAASSADRSRRRPRRGASPPSPPGGSSANGWPAAEDGGVEVDDLHLLPRRGEAVQLLVPPVERLLDPLQVVEVVRRETDRDLVVLPGVAQVGGGDDAPALLGHALLGERLEPLARELVDDGARLGGVDVLPVARVAAREVVAQVGEQHAERAEDRREPRHDDRRELELVGDRARMHRPGAAGGDERQLARVVPALDRDVLRAGGHVEVDHLGHRRGRLDRAEAERPRDAALDGLAGPLERELHPAAEEVVGVDVAEHEVGVGARRLARRRGRRPRGRGWRLRCAAPCGAGRRRRASRSSRRRRRSCARRSSAARSRGG